MPDGLKEGGYGNVYFETCISTPKPAWITAESTKETQRRFNQEEYLNASFIFNSVSHSSSCL